MSDVHYLYHSLIADLTSIVTAISPHNLMMQVVESRGRAEGLFAVSLKHLVGKTTQNLVRDSAIRVVRWLGSLEQTHPHQRTGRLHCMQWIQREASLSYHSLLSVIVKEMTSRVSFDRYPRLAAR